MNHIQACLFLRNHDAYLGIGREGGDHLSPFAHKNAVFLSGQGNVANDLIHPETHGVNGEGVFFGCCCSSRRTDSSIVGGAVWMMIITTRSSSTSIVTCRGGHRQLRFGGNEFDQSLRCMTHGEGIPSNDDGCPRWIGPIQGRKGLKRGIIIVAS